MISVTATAGSPAEAEAIVAAWLSVEAPDEDELENIAKLNEL